MLFGFNYDALTKATDGLTHADSLIQPHGGGNCLNWVVGHIAATRNTVLELVQEKPILAESVAVRYGQGSSPITTAEDAHPFEQLIDAFRSAQEPLVSALGRLSAAQLAAPSRLGRTVGELLAILQFHEAYHIGQAGLLRRILGRPGAI
jgi:hypothetical protein